MNPDIRLLRFLQLISPGLPIGMYSYSQGLERAVQDGWITSVSDAEDWFLGLLQQNLSKVDAPILVRLYEAWLKNNTNELEYWSNYLCACRETSELRAEDRQTGQALARLLSNLDIPEAKQWQKKPEATYATVFSLAAVKWQIDLLSAITGYLWSWLENQVLCAVKLIPLGQVAGQTLLKSLADQLPGCVTAAMLISDHEIGGGSIGLSLASSRHEMQYSRLFRS
jgi:urease accessory protein